MGLAIMDIIVAAVVVDYTRNTKDTGSVGDIDAKADVAELLHLRRRTQEFRSRMSELRLVTFLGSPLWLDVMYVHRLHPCWKVPCRVTHTRITNHCWRK